MASTALCGASVRVVVESRHRPARRQASVIVANLATTDKLRGALLAATVAVEGPGLVDSLVGSAMGDDRYSREGFGAVGVDGTEEEIGTRRECMRALVGLVECRVVRDMVRISHRSSSIFFWPGVSVCCRGLLSWWLVSEGGSFACLVILWKMGGGGVLELMSNIKKKNDFLGLTFSFYGLCFSHSLKLHIIFYKIRT